MVGRFSTLEGVARDCESEREDDLSDANGGYKSR